MNKIQKTTKQIIKAKPKGKCNVQIDTGFDEYFEAVQHEASFPCNLQGSQLDSYSEQLCGAVGEFTYNSYGD